MKLLSTRLILLALYVAGNALPAFIGYNSAIASEYKGPVKTFDYKVFSKLRPFPPSSFTKTIKSTWDGKVELKSQEVTISRSNLPSGNFYLKMEIRVGDKTATARFEQNRAGKFTRFVDIQGDGKIYKNIEANKKIETFLRLFTSAIFIPTLHTKGVKFGELLPVEFIGIPGTGTITKRRVVGLTVFNKHNSILIDYAGSSIELNGQKFTGNGYGLYSLDLGILIFSQFDVVGALKTLGRKFINFKFSENTIIRVPESETQWSGVASRTSPPKPEPPEVRPTREPSGIAKVTPRKPKAAGRAEVGTGSGFFISKSGHIVTNAHVVNGCKRITVGDNTSTQSRAALVSTDKKSDLALLKIGSLQMASAETKSLIQKLGIKVVPLVAHGLLRSEDVELGESVLVAGFPFGDRFSNTIKVTGGMVSAIRGIADDSGQFQMDAAAQRGNSGGPIYDENGNIVGVVVAQLNKLKVAKTTGSLPENVNFGIKASTVRQFLTASGLPSKWSTRSKKMSTRELAKVAQRQTLMVMCHP